MKCQSCGKKEARVRYKENINGIKQEIFLCTECAKNMGFVDFSSIFSPMFVSIPNLMYEHQELACKTCGYTLDDYSKTGMFGCTECYNTFEDTLDELFIKIHGKNRHVKLQKKNNKSNVNSKNNELEKLKTKIQDLIADEKYEEAAIVRDQIKDIEGK